MCSGSETDSYLRLIDSCITQLKASKEEREGVPPIPPVPRSPPGGSAAPSACPNTPPTSSEAPVGFVDFRPLLTFLTGLRVGVWGCRFLGLALEFCVWG